MENNLITIDKNIYESLKGELVTLHETVAGLEDKLRQQEVEFARMADNVPGMIYQFQLAVDGTISFPYVSSGCREFYELDPQQVEENPQLLFDMVHDDDLSRLQETINISAQSLQKWESEWRIITHSGKEKWLYGVSQPVLQPGGNIVWDGCLIDISQRVSANKLKQGEGLLNGIANATSCLLTTQNYQNSINAALAELGKAAAVDRIYIFENYSHPVTKELLVSHRWEWVADGVAAEIDFSLLQNLSYDYFSPLWYEYLSQGKPIASTVDDFPEVERKLLQAQGIRSIFVIPIKVRDKWWGFIGFEDYKTLRQWSNAEKSILQASAISFGGAIAHYQAEYELKCLNEELENRVKERTFALAASEARLQRLAGNVPGMLYQYQISTNGDVRFSYISDGCRELFGVEPEQIRRNSDIIHKMIHPDDVAGFNQSIADSVQSLNKWEYEWRITTHGGEEKWLQGFSRLEQQPDGMIFSDGCIIDISKRKLAEFQSQEQEQFLRIVYNGSEHVIFVVDVLEDGVFRYAGCNPAWEHATGIPKEKVIGKTLYELYGDVLGKQIEQTFIECLQAGTPITYEECLNFDGTPRWWFTTLNPLKDDDDRIYRLVGTTLEITERKRAEEVVRSSEKNL